MAKRPPDKHGPFSREALFLAAAIDEIRLLRRDLVKVLGGELKGEFEPIPRPGIGPRRRCRNPHAASIIAAIADEHARLHRYGKYTDQGADAG
jgi:hypothetical protein